MTDQESDRRIDGENGWKKAYCAWSKETWYAWHKWDTKHGMYCCTCEPCLPPVEKSEVKNAEM